MALKKNGKPSTPKGNDKGKGKDKGLLPAKGPKRVW